MKRLLRDNRGMTLAEMLLAVLLLLAVVAIVSQIVPVAQDAYRKIVDKANAELLASTTLSMIRNELDLASEVAEDRENGALITYRSGGMLRSISAGNEAGLRGLVVKEYNEYAESGVEDTASWKLVSDQTRTGLSVTVGSIEYTDDGVFKILNIEVKKAGNSNVYASIKEFDVRAYNIR